MSADIPYPRHFIAEHLAEALRNDAYEAEQRKTLHERQYAIILSQNWFNLYVPHVFGGLELPLPEILRIEEGIAWADASSAWVVTLCSGAAWFVGFLDRSLASGLFKSNSVCFAGSGALTGIADRTSGGYEINGYWPYATGSLFATAFTVNCLVRENGRQVYVADGSPLVNSFVLMRDEVKIHPTWHAMGMVATGSHSIEVKNVTIPASRSFIIHADHAVLENPVFRYPFLQLAETTLTVNLSGMACRFLDLCGVVSAEKNNDMLAGKISESGERLKHARNIFYRQSDNAWHSLVTGREIPKPLLADVSNASHALVDCSREVIGMLYPYLGLEAADTGNEMNRIWRNFHTAGQHGLFRNFRLQNANLK